MVVYQCGGDETERSQHDAHDLLLVISNRSAMRRAEQNDHAADGEGVGQKQKWHIQVFARSGVNHGWAFGIGYLVFRYSGIRYRAFLCFSLYLLLPNLYPLSLRVRP